MYVILVALLAIAASFFYYYIKKSQSHWKQKGIKHEEPTFFFGENLGVALKKEHFMDLVKRVYEQFPGERYSGTYQFSEPLLVLRDPELIKQLTIKDFDHFVDRRSFIKEEHDPLFGKNLLSLKGQKWRDMRATLSPSFTSSKMKTMFILMSDVAETFVKHFQKSPEDVVSVELKDIFTRFANDVIASSAFGIKIDSLANQENDFYSMGKRITDFSGFVRNIKFWLLVIAPQIAGWLKIRLLEEDLTSYFKNLVKDTIRTREEQHIVRPDMLNLLMEARKGGSTTSEDAKIPSNLSDDDITAQALIFFFAGFDSISTMLCFMGYELAINQKIQDRLREEIKETLKENNGKITYDALMKMKYLDMVVSETLRKWPVTVAVDRVCTKPYTIQPEKPDEKPLHLPVGSVIFVPSFGILRDPQYYPDPEKFDPERFSEENKGNINPYTYLPFGIGPRNCIGNRFALMEGKILWFHILNNFKIVPTEKSKVPIKINKKLINVSAEGGFWFGFQKL